MVDLAKPVKKFGRFEIRSRLGAGAFGMVYRAYDPLLSRDLALKIPQASALDKPAAIARFLREPKAAAQLRHPHIVPVYDAGVEAGKYYIASAFIEGTTLESAVEDDPFDFRRAAETVRDLAEALDYAHQLGVIHRDIKPANIMLDTRGDAMLMDFGLARVEAAEEITHDNALLGTPAYMAPEQAARNQEAVGPHSDQYSLGVVLYELLCGQRPFSGPPAIIIYNAIHETPPRPRSIRADVPADLETIVLKTLSKQPAERFSNCQDFADDLRRWLDDEPIKARRLSVRERAWRWTKRNPMLALLGLAVAVLAIVSTLAATALELSRGQLSESLAHAKSLTEDARVQTALANEQTEIASEQTEIAEREAKVAEQQERLAAASEVKAKERKHVAETARLRQELEVEKRTSANSETSKFKAQREKDLEKISEADDRKLKAKEAEAEAQRQSELAAIEAAWAEYCRLLTAAQVNQAGGDVDLAVKLLDECPEELRGWEWDVLMRLCGGERIKCQSAKMGGVGTVAHVPGNVVAANHDGSLVLFNEQDGSPAWYVCQMPDNTQRTTSLRDASSIIFNSNGSLAAYSDSEKLWFLDLHAGRSVRPRLAGAPSPQMLGFTADGYLLSYKPNVPTKGLKALAFDSKAEPQQKVVFPNFQIWLAALSEDGKLLFAAGTSAEGIDGLVYGPPDKSPIFQEIAEPISQIVALGGVAVLTHPSGRRSIIDVELGTLKQMPPLMSNVRGASAIPPLNRGNVAEVREKMAEIAKRAEQFQGATVVSLSPNAKRMLLRGPISAASAQATNYYLADTRTGQVVPNLPFLPWNCVDKKEKFRVQVDANHNREAGTAGQVVKQVLPHADWERFSLMTADIIPTEKRRAL